MSPSPTQGLLLALNAGSSSIKLGLFRMQEGRAQRIAHGLLDLQRQPLQLQLETDGRQHRLPLAAPLADDLHAVLEATLGALAGHFDLGELRGIGHRVVHGGLQFHEAVRVDDAHLTALQALTPLAPLHQRHSLRLIRALRHLRPQLPQTASFDTAFHITQHPLARRLALPRAMHEAGLQRYGFHGLSYRYIAGVLARRHPGLCAGRVVVAHLGSGASVCAMQAGRSVDTSMGFSTLDGLPMGTRCGALDPGVVLHLLQHHGMDAEQIENLLYHHAGLLGVSGLAADVRTLRASAEPAAREALDLFALRCAGEIARASTTLGGLDAVVFTAGIGEHDAATRAAVCAHLQWLGLVLDDTANRRHDETISAAASRIAVLVVGTDEEQTIADDTLALLAT